MKNKPVVLIALIAVCVGCLSVWRRFVPTPSMASIGLSNADFERGDKQWFFYFNESAGKHSDDAGIGGSSCLTLAVSDDRQFDGFSQFLELEGASGCTVEFCGLVRATGRSIQAALYIEYNVESWPSFISELTGDGQTISATSPAAVPSGEWQELTVSLSVPESVDQIRVFGVANGTSGRAWFDDFEVMVIDLVDQNQ